MRPIQILKFLLLLGIALFSVSIMAYLRIIDIRLSLPMFVAGVILTIVILFGPLLIRPRA